MKKTVSLAIAAVLLLSLVAFIPKVARADGTQPMGTFVLLQGMIDRYGFTPVMGMVMAQGEIPQNSSLNPTARAFAMWTTMLTLNGSEIVPPNATIQNFTYSFFAARLVSTTSVALNSSGNDLIISGLWDVYNVTFVYYPNSQGEFDGDNATQMIQPMASNATGDLTVTGNWAIFQLSITGINTLSGIVIERHVEPKEIELGDINGDGNVGLDDLVHEAKAYGSKPGLSNFDFSGDFDFSFQIDISDLTTIAGNID